MPPSLTAANWVPSAEEAMEDQLSLGALVSVHVWAGAAWAKARRMQICAARKKRDNVFIVLGSIITRRFELKFISSAFLMAFAGCRSGWGNSSTADR